MQAVSFFHDGSKQLNDRFSVCFAIARVRVDQTIDTKKIPYRNYNIHELNRDANNCAPLQ